MVTGKSRKLYLVCLFFCPDTDTVLSTAHKAKGLEFSTVRLTDDYMNQQGPVNNPFTAQGKCYPLPLNHLLTQNYAVLTRN